MVMDEEPGHSNLVAPPVAVIPEGNLLMLTRAILAPCLLILAACGSSNSTPSGSTATAPATAASAAPVRVVDAASVAECRFLSAITESRYSGILFAGNGLRIAQDKVIASAGGIGATHVVWSDMNAGGAVQTATGLAYRCD
ncbi:hypothetical protein [Ovoidimarina sediminis]|uniref:hypothetical protein n=1 Tax=Ovoidimarina sediminis TaxID=3079856 RepID=UPI002910AB34|nr:hypothetical protein [Rhodophyticola sp. MJ-SS7]MDU8944822.1 hypothetical protein [Rhodophyticola sp. MJ-SS7]